ncbi:WGR domain-containing protein [Bradyrhizobium sp. CCBAU 11361]|uniref:WGR domain-containing protein n=1 Tax=Bradyrhizobium sp. CCBAU 11361 TaxID=1630812 RepID=UPI0023022B18|nr:WGR domain-containing protein [Bradyrhizobium sp. CCBAU 11361]MDA9488890.1 polymerase [Bradyrhizobium sp. CCBAU 11361]
MPNLILGPLHLRRFEATRNMRRFYLLSIQPTLFGGVSLIRNWGRIGTSGQVLMRTFEDSAGAGEAFGRLERTKRRRGYASAEEKV